MIQPKRLAEALETIEQAPASLIYISREDCSVCHAILPRTEQLLQNFTIPSYQLDADQFPEVASEFEVMTVPALMVFSHGKELHRQARFINLKQVEDLLTELTQTTSTLSYEELFQ
ncbi:thiol reductase thioredoxin [Enterococcus sp. JM4C]|uniref:thioredoxin family protein n=1 Tax=Candidatus Enterococcus huntleyi TaxID=1857217 RepID=UPI0013799816|nr:thioredoxin family protein [Enterococcus sp. JM4C]KAF1295687.1 thiol reductase thioredoxin [Enterococcus sp. JM4C]